jgi:uncharacterized protein
VPFLYWLMADPAWSGVWVEPEHQATLAHATSLAVIVPSALSGFLAYRRAGLMDLTALLPIGMAAAVAALLGAQLAVHLPGTLLKGAFGLLLLLIGVQILRGKQREGEPPAGGSAGLRLSGALFGGGVIGMLSAILGIGGGVIAVPILIRWARMDLHRITAASIGIILFAAPAGILSYMFAGQDVAGLPAGSVGYVSLPLAAAMIPGAVLLAPFGARLNQRLPVKILRRLFSVYLLGMGLRLVFLYLLPR